MGVANHVITILVITFILLAPDTHSKKTTSSSTQYKVPAAYANFIRNSCKTTTYPSLCRKTLSPYASAVKTNALKLCTTALTVALDYTGNCSTSVSKLTSQNNITRTEGRTEDCIGDLKDVVYELRQTVSAIGHLGDGDREFQWANAKTYASAAITDAETCVDDILGQKVNASVKKKIRSCVSGAEQHISNALALINHLY